MSVVILLTDLISKTIFLVHNINTYLIFNQGKGEMKELLDKEVTDMVSLVRVLSQWTSMFPYDFRDDRVMALVRSITQR